MPHAGHLIPPVSLLNNEPKNPIFAPHFFLDGHEHSGGRLIKRASALAAKLFHNPHLQAATLSHGFSSAAAFGNEEKAGT
jgi:hypothetical protein